VIIAYKGSETLYSGGDTIYTANGYVFHRFETTGTFTV
jgi:hypothetical protein